MFVLGLWRGLARGHRRPVYSSHVVVGAEDVAREIRERLPHVGVKKLHKLLYLCQGHQMAFSGAGLFRETISAWDHGPVVAQLWWREQNDAPSPPAQPLDEGQLNTVGYVISRYGRLTGRDLEDLTHAQAPWRVADLDRAPGSSARIEPDSLEAFFRLDAEDDDEGAPIDRDLVRRFLTGAKDRAQQQSRPDSEAELRRRLSDAG